MKRCPHCGQEDHDEAILCKKCFKNFSEPVARKRPAGAATPGGARKKSGGFPFFLLTIGLAYALSQPWVQETIREVLAPDEDSVEPGPVQDAGVEPASPREPSPQVPVAPPSAPVAEPPVRDAERAPVERPRPGLKPPLTADREAERTPAKADEPAPPSAPADSRPVPAAGEPRESAAPVRVGGEIKPPRRIRGEQPRYPPAAQASRTEGVVIIEATIDASGRVQQTRVLRSIPTLDAAALDAVKTWEYEPTLRDGVPVPVIMTVTVRFTLQ